jgi:hypothetical protein
MTTSNHPEQPRLPLTVRRGRAGELLRSLAGAPAGWRRSRRGSFLVMVVGTLALLAVLTIIYASIGTHDSRLTAATTSRARADEVPEQVRDYILSIIGESVTATYYDSKYSLLPSAGGGPMPVLLSRVTFDFPSTDWQRRSDEPSNPRYVFNPTGSVSGFLFTPDFSFTPHNLMPDRWRPSTPWLADTEPTYLDFNAAGPSDPSRPYLDKRDWGHISNIAPDGRFVNLWNLRNNFDAPSGFGPGAMSDNTQFVYHPTSGGNNRPTVTLTDFGVPVDPAVPAHLDSRQVWLFRPARPSPGAMPSQPNYDLYLFADADGDGMFDSRWQELYDARYDRGVLNTDGRYRFFVATRIIDASSLINVNTATDLLAEPTAEAPIGLSAGEVDLRRLLTMHDQYTINSGGLAEYAGYNYIHQPANPNSSANYDQLDRTEAYNTGIYAYDALRIAIASGGVPPAGPTLDGPGLANVASLLGLAPEEWSFRDDPWLRTQHYRRVSTSLYNASYESNEIFLSGGFGAADMLELLTRRAVNDPTTSALELTLGGRADNFLSPAETSPFSPLRSNRPLDIEQRRYTNATIGSAPDNPTDYERTMLFFDSDVRSRLTPISGARQFRTAVAEINNFDERTVDPYALGTNELRIDPKPLLRRIRMADHPTTMPWPLSGAELSARQSARAARSAATNTLFTAYADALLPRSGIPSTRDPWAPGSTERWTEFYGYRGPELALRVAAHMTVNFIDAFDSGDAGEKPTVHTLYVDGSFTPSYPANDPRALSFWDRDTDGDINNNLNPTTRVENEDLAPLSLLSRRLADGHPVTAPVVNVYGIEAQPFITQVATFTVYADKKRSGDNEDSSTFSNIEGGTDPGNEDLMYRVLAFQLHNPFDQDIELGGRLDKSTYDLHQHPTSYYNVTDLPRLDIEESYYYIKFGDKVYKLAELEEQTYVTLAEAADAHAQNMPAFGDPEVDPANLITREIYIPPSGRTNGKEPIVLKPIRIPAGQSVVVYSLSDTPKAVLERLSVLDDPGTAGGYAADTNATPTRKVKEIRRYIKQAIETNLGFGADGVAGVYWIPEMATAGADEGRAIIPVKHNVLPSTSGTLTVELWRALRNGAEAEPVPVTMPNRFWETTITPPNLGTTYAFPPNITSNDQLVDRFRVADVEQLDRKLASTQYEVDGSDYDDSNFLYMITLWANYSRPGNPASASPRAPIGAIPAYCLEPKFNAGGWNNFRDDPLNISDRSIPVTAFKGAGDSTFTGLASSVRAWLVNMSDTNNRLAPIGKSPDELTERITNVTTVGTVPYDAHYPEIPLPSNNASVSVNGSSRAVLRPADMLLPLGIGPEEMFIDSSGNLVTDLEQRWTTLSEALAMCLGYQTTPAPGVDVSTPYYLPNRLFDPRVLDRGNLRLDDYVPFIDHNSNGVFDYGVDERVGLQIPMALNILDIFTINPVDPEGGTWESLKRAMPGLINVNTAPLATLRAGLSMLCPPPAQHPNGQPWWWGAGSVYDDRIDIAASVFAYRHKQDAYLTATAAAAAPFGVVNFSDSVTPDQPDSVLDGRYASTQIPGIGEQPGFRSPAQLQTVRFRNNTTPPTPGTIPPEWGYRVSMDFTGFDTETVNDPGITPPAGVTYPAGANGRVGIDSVLYTNPANPAGDRIPSNISNSYKEQLAIINSVLPSVSTRSDYFIVYFLIHGYQKSDCNVQGDDPLIPSIARRFVMVVDRSKVTRRGDKPEVLLFKELPVDPVR